MSEKERKPPHEAWDDLEEMGDDDEVERILAMKDAELDTELRRVGADPEALAAKGQALGRELEGKRAPKPRVVPLYRRVSVWVGASGLAAAAAFALEAWTPATITGHAPPVLDAEAATHAATLREAAFVDCESGRFEACARELDLARNLDPAGENEPRVVRARGVMAGRDAR